MSVPESDTRYFPSPGTLYPAGRSIALIADRTDGSVVEVGPLAARLYRTCTGARSIAEHLAALTGFAEDAHTLAAALDRLAGAHVLRPEARLPPPVGPRASVRSGLSDVVVITADSTPELQRCLSSLAEHAAHSGSGWRTFVVDASMEDTAMALNRASTVAFNNSGCVVRYIGIEETSALCDRLAGVTRDDATLLRRLLAPRDRASARNLGLLLTAGRRVLLVDDGVICSPWTPADGGEGLVCGGHFDQRDTEVFPNRESAFRATKKTSVDLLDAHGFQLGRTLNDLLMDAHDAVDRSRTCQHLMAAIVLGSGHRVRITATGLSGDAGNHCAYRSTLLACASTPTTVLRDETAFTWALDGGAIRRIARQLIVTHGYGGPELCVGIDNEELIPPFCNSSGGLVLLA